MTSKCLIFISNNTNALSALNLFLFTVVCLANRLTCVIGAEVTDKTTEL